MSNIIYTSFVTRAPEYSSTEDLCTAFKCCKRTIARRIEELEKETERYGNHVVIHDGGIILVNYLAFVDYLTYRKRLMQPNLRKYVPEYNPRAIEQELGRKPEVEAM